MPKRNLTLQLDEKTIRRAKVLAAKRGASLSALVAIEIERLADRDDRYEEARSRAMKALHRPGKHGGRSWERSDLYDL